MVKDTIRGLRAGAPVEYRGVLIGNVVTTNIYSTLKEREHELIDEDIAIPVLIGLQPARVGAAG